MGKSYKKSLDYPQSSDVYYPSFGLDSDKMPEVKSMEVGETYEMCIKCKVTSKSEGKSKKVNVYMDVKECGMMDKGKKEKSLDKD